MICPQLPSALARLGLNGLISRVAGGRLDLYGLLLRVALCVMLAAGVQPANSEPGPHQNTGAPVQADSPTDAEAIWSTQPRTKTDGQRWRIGYIESGVYSEYPLTLRAEFTASVLVACARAVHRMHGMGQFGAKTIFDVPLGLLSPRSAEALRAELL